MRIKLTNIIGVSLISLSVAFSAISSASAGYSGGGAMENYTTGGGVMGGNTTGGGSTTHKDNDVETQEEKDTCLGILDGAEGACSHLAINKRPPYSSYGQWLRWNDCLSAEYAKYETCRCEAGNRGFCPGGKFDLFREIDVELNIGRYPDTIATPFVEGRKDIFGQSSHNATVDDQLAPATRAKTSRRPSPKIKASAGVVKRRGR